MSSKDYYLKENEKVFNDVLERASNELKKNTGLFKFDDIIINNIFLFYKEAIINKYKLKENPYSSISDFEGLFLAENFVKKFFPHFLSKLDKKELINYLILDDKNKKELFRTSMNKHICVYEGIHSIYNKDFTIDDFKKFLDTTYSVIESFNKDNDLKLNVLENNSVEDLLRNKDVDIMLSYFNIIENEFEDINNLLL